MANGAWGGFDVLSNAVNTFVGSVQTYFNTPVIQAPASPSQVPTAKPSQETAWTHTAEQIERWAPPFLLGFAAIYCFLKHPISFGIGLSIAAYQKKYPDHLSQVVEKVAKQYFPFKDKPYGVVSFLVEKPETSLTIIALACMGSSNFAQFGAATYFTYRGATAFFSPSSNGDGPIVAEK